MAKTKDKPKSASQIKRNDGRRSGKAWKKNSGPTFTTPGVSPKSARGGKFGYSHKRLVKMAAQQGVTLYTVIEQLGDKLTEREYNRKIKPRQSAARPGIGDCTFKMTSVDRHFDKRRPYPSVPKGLKHAGKLEKKTDRRQDNEQRELLTAAA